MANRKQRLAAALDIPAAPAPPGYHYRNRIALVSYDIGEETGSEWLHLDLVGPLTVDDLDNIDEVRDVYLGNGRRFESTLYKKGE